MSIRAGWKGVVVALSLAVLGLTTCGGPGGPPVSHLTKRAFVSDNIDGTLHIEDAQHDVESGFTISTGSQPGIMALSPDKSLTLVFDSGDKTLAVVSNASESVLGRISLPDISTSFVSMSDNTVGFAAVPNCPLNSCGGFSHVVQVVDLATTFNVTGTINVDSMTGQPLNATTTLVLSPTGNKLLVFGGRGEHVDTLTVIDTSTAKTTPSKAATQIGGFDRPVSAVFSSDGTKAFVFNCGPECGKAGTSASVAVLDMTTSTPTVVGTPIPLPAATVGLLSGNKLFVAGTPSGTLGALAGKLSVLDTTALATPASFVNLSDGYHNHMELGSNGQLFIGAITCSAGCLTIFDTNKNSAVVDSNTGNVTGIAPISARNVVYVVEDLVGGSFLGPGELRIYDTTTDALTPSTDQIDIVGKAVDVKFVDP